MPALAAAVGGLLRIGQIGQCVVEWHGFTHWWFVRPTSFSQIGARAGRLASLLSPSGFFGDRCLIPVAGREAKWLSDSFRRQQFVRPASFPKVRVGAGRLMALLAPSSCFSNRCLIPVAGREAITPLFLVSCSSFHGDEVLTPPSWLFQCLIFLQLGMGALAALLLLVAGGYRSMLAGASTLSADLGWHLNLARLGGPWFGGGGLQPYKGFISLLTRP